MNVISMWMTLFSVLFPAKMWFAPNAPITVGIKSDKPLTLVMTTFDGKRVDAGGPTDVAANGSADVRTLFPAVNSAGTYLLFAVPKSSGAVAPSPADFVGTPIVINVLADARAGAPPGPMVVRVRPLQFAVMHTDAGPMTMIFYYDVAPNTAESFLRLSTQGFFDGLTFHRIIPGFVLQGGDPRGDGTGGPGYNVGAEFNDRPHEEGALSMARNGDPNEPALMPRPEFANSAGSQFFVCLDYEHTKALDRKYTVFGKVVDGLDTMKKLAATPLADEAAGRPAKPPVIQTVEVMPVTSGHNPYAAMLGMVAK